MNYLRCPRLWSAAAARYVNVKRANLAPPCNQLGHKRRFLCYLPFGSGLELVSLARQRRPVVRDSLKKATAVPSESDPAI